MFTQTQLQDYAKSLGKQTSPPPDNWYKAEPSREMG